jgi:hypothetical protein
MADDHLPEFPPEDAESYEAIDPSEVDLVVGALRKLIRQVSSPTIKDLLQETRHDVANLAVEEEEFDLDDDFADFNLENHADFDGDYREAA